jgi:hypothetical protein
MPLVISGNEVDDGEVLVRDLLAADSGGRLGEPSR